MLDCLYLNFQFEYLYLTCNTRGACGLVNVQSDYVRFIFHLQPSARTCVDCRFERRPIRVGLPWTSLFRDHYHELQWQNRAGDDHG
jgi:hypothetical protein